jgi:hypothetical protein
MHLRSFFAFAACVVAFVVPVTSIGRFSYASIAVPGVPVATPLAEKSFTLDAPAEVSATVRAICERCDWGVAGREGAALEIAVNGRYRSHLMLTRGREEADYRVLLGHYDRGAHNITIVLDGSKSAGDTGTVRVTGIDVASIGEGDPSYDAVAHAPILHARPNTIGHFSDVPLLMWYETEATARGRLHRYSVIFSNEDGGTATDRLMATWGRTTDIEFVYGVEVDANGLTLAEEFQGPDHVVTPFRGAHENLHPLEFVVTDNNMVSDAGTTAVRYAPAPELFDLTNRSREVVMDAYAWSYRVTSLEMMREGKIVEQAAPGSGKIPDPRRFVFVEACSDLVSAALSFGVRAGRTGGSDGAGGAGRAGRTAGTDRAGGPSGAGGQSRADGPSGARGSGRASGDVWYESDRGRDDFRIVRTGCFRGAVPLPQDASPPDAIRFRARPGRDTGGKPPSVRITRVNHVFMLGDDFLPKPSRFSWTGSMVLEIDGTPAELPFDGAP